MPKPILATRSAVTYLTDTAAHAPPTSGAYDWNSFQADSAGFPAAGSSYTDPVFGGVITRITAIGASDTGDQSRYVHNGNISANNTYARLDPTDSGSMDVIKLSDRTTTRANVGGSHRTACMFDPVDDEIIWRMNGSVLEGYNFVTNSVTYSHTFGGTLKNLGGSIDWCDRTGEYFLVNVGTTAYIWKKSTDEIFTGTPTVQDTGTTGGYLGLTPAGDFIVEMDGGTVRTWAVNTSTKTVTTTAVTNWTNSTDDHADVVSCSDGKSRMVLIENNYDYDIRSFELGVDRSGMTDAQQIADSTLLMNVTSSAFNDEHFSGVGKGTLQDWVLLSTYSDSTRENFDGSPTGWEAFQGELFLINAITGAVRRYAHHRSRSAKLNYARTPRASVSWDGTTVIFQSNTNRNDYAAGYADIYKLAL